MNAREAEMFARVFTFQERADNALARRNMIEYQLSSALAALTAKMAKQVQCDRA